MVLKEVERKSELPERIQELKNRVLSRRYQADFERAKWYTRVYKSTEGQPIGPCMPAALGLQETMRNMPIRIEDEELIVGSKSAKEWGGPLYVELGLQLREILIPLMFYKNEKKIKEAFPNGLASTPPEFLEELAKISEEEYQLLTNEILPYWKDKSMMTRQISRWKQEGLVDESLKTVLEENKALRGFTHVFQAPVYDTYELFAPVIPGFGHLVIGLRKVLGMGFKGIARQATARLEELRKDLEAGKITEEEFNRSKDFLESVHVSAMSVCEFSERYAKLAEKMAKKAEGQRKIELLEIAERCRRVPAEPPRNFMEALQAIWLTQVAIIIAYGDGSITCPGRVDQYLYPYYKHDIEAGRITREKALEMIMEYDIKLATNIYFGPSNVTIGGVDRNGENGVNEVSYLILEAHKRLRGCGRNGLAVRIQPKKTPLDFPLKVCEVHRYTGGIAFYNDEVVIRNLMEDGYSLEDARDWGIIGCVEPMGSGNSNGMLGVNGPAIRLPSILEMALNEGGLVITGWKRVGAPTPPASTFKTFEDVKKAFEEQLSYAFEVAVPRMRSAVEQYPIPLLSATIEGCIESGKDVVWGGARYNHGAVGAQSIASIANSLAAIKWAVFDKKLLTMEELVKHLRNNFHGAEEIRQLLLLKAPKYGNDDPYVDEIAKWVAEVYNRETRKLKSRTGMVYRPLLISVSGTQMHEGAIIGATPDGRLAHTPVSNGIAPVNGTELNGLTAVLCSAAAISEVPISCGTSLTVNLSPMTIKTDEGLEKFASMIEAYLAMGGRQVQFNPMGKETLLDAQKHPENYPDLVVKVSGYSWRFVDLSKPLQDDIIARCEFGA